MRSIKTILILSLSTVIVLVGFATALVYYHYISENEKACMARFVSKESKILPREIAGPLWKYDLDGVRLLCGERLKDSRLQSIKVVDDEKRVVFHKSDENRTASASITTPIMHGNETIGTLHVAFNQSDLLQRKKEIFIFACFMLFLVAGTAILVVLLLTRRLVTDPIDQIAHILGHLQDEKYDWTFQETSLKEMHPIIEGLKELSRKLRERQKRIETQTRSLEEYNQTLVEEIQRRKQITNELETTRKKTQLIIDQSPIGICTVDLEGRIVSANPAYADMLGYAPEELTGVSFFDLTHPDDRPKNRKVFDNMRSAKAPGFDIEKRYIRKNGTVIHIRLHAAAVRDGTGTTQFGTAFVEDITAGKQAEIELLQSKQFIESVINGIADPVFVKDENNRWIMFNDAFCRMLGHSREELLGKTDHDFLPADQADIFLEHDSNALASQEPDINEEEISVGKRTRILSTIKSSFDNPITGTRNLVGTIRDITDIKRTEDQLRQAQKMESVGRLAGGVAHDFNNMLGVILGHADMLLDKVDPSLPIRANLEEIRKAAERSAELTRQLLAFARKQTVSPKVLDLNGTLAGMLKMLKRLIGEDIDLAWTPGNGVWAVKIDPGQVDQLLVNLCVNARDAIEGVGKMTIETGNMVFDQAYCDYHAGFRPGEFVLLAVSDNGCGMDQETVENIFEPFFTTKKSGKGTGLGLATVYGIVKQNDGFINVYSEPDAGTTFKIYLPRHTGEAGEIPAQAPIQDAATGHETILVVEDEATILNMITAMLQGLGYTTIPAATPGKAIGLAESHPEPIDLLLTDVVMPEMNGRDLAGKIMRRHPDAACLFMSGYTANVIAHRGVLEEGVQFIQKPFSLQDLATKLRELLDDGHRNQPD